MGGFDPDQVLEAVGEVLGDAGRGRRGCAPGALGWDRRAGSASCAARRAGSSTRREQRGARRGAQSSPGRRAAWCARRRTRPPTPSPVRSRSASRHTTSLLRTARSTSVPADGESGIDAHAEAGARLDEPLEQLGRFDRLGDHRDRVALEREPRAGEVPVAEVRQREHRAAALGHAGRDVLDAGALEVVVDPLAARSVGQPEQLVEVAAVRVERRGDGPAQRRRRRTRVRGRAAGCAPPGGDGRAMTASPRACARPRAAGSPTAGGHERARSRRRRGTRSTAVRFGRIRATRAVAGRVSDDATRNRTR